MLKTAVLGFPRMGKDRELKKALEQFWRGDVAQDAFLATAQSLRAEHWRLMQTRGIDIIPSNDFSCYDQVLDMICMVGAVPDRFAWDGGEIDLELYFAMARGRQSSRGNVPAMEMTKWFDTNYHYIVPELKSGQKFGLHSRKALNEFEEAKALGIITRPVLLGPVSFLLLGKMAEGDGSPLELLPALLPVYEELLTHLADAGAEWVQIDEPCLVWDRQDEAAEAYRTVYQKLTGHAALPKFQLTSYFGGVRHYQDVLEACPVAGLHIDLVRAPEQLEPVLSILKPGQRLSLGVIDGRNVWRSNLEPVRAMIEKAVAQSDVEIVLSTSCSLLHSPFSLEGETALDPDLKTWLAFATEKLDELALLKRWTNQGGPAAADALAGHRSAIQSRQTSAKVHRPEVVQRCREVEPAMLQRQSSFAGRKLIQQEKLQLPVLPTTTIGSFPQTREVRLQRRDFKAGQHTREQYEQFLREETQRCIAFQEAVGLDVLVHGEYERNDMVEYFGEQLEGFAFTRNGWVQSYGSRCVKPPIIYGDVSRKAPMTVDWSTYAQSLTGKPMKGMLTGPVTILQWSFVRDDQPRRDTCQQIALAIRDEVGDLETAGIRIIQIDEPALREGLPLNRKDWQAYLTWAVDCFRLASAGVEDGTQIHTHMCYADFEDILDAIAALDADVISIEASRSDMVPLRAFGEFNYPNDIGPGVYDIHSPLVPSAVEIVAQMRKAMAVFPVERLWINPDCGLKTRDWPEVEAALKNMVTAARQLRKTGTPSV